ncbi:hypothetical protein T10_4330, partial [Trichinella papuae]
MKVNCTIFEFFSLIIGGVDHRTFILVCICYQLAMGIQQRTSLDFESRSSIKKIQRL